MINNFFRQGSLSSVKSRGASRRKKFVLILAAFALLVLPVFAVANTEAVQSVLSRGQELFSGSQSYSFADAAPVQISTDASSSGFHIYSWGSNASGQLGLGDSSSGTHRNVPTRMPGGANWTQLATGENASVAISVHGHLYAWGANWSDPQMGQGTNPSPGAGNITAPVRVGTASNWVFVAARSATIAAINSEGHLYIWGNVVGMGNGANVPTRVFPDVSWRKISMHNTLVVAMSDHGHIYTWGTNAHGQLGRPVTAVHPADIPGRVGERSDWAEIVVGDASALALTEDGELYSWGRNHVGQLGLGDTTNRNTPQRVGAASNWIAMGMTSSNAAAAINSYGELWTWGNTANGQLGRPATAIHPASLPGRVGTSNNWLFVASANSHFLIFNSDYELWSWGNNVSGQLGIGATGGYEEAPIFIVRTYGFSGAARGGGLRSLMLMHTNPVETGFPLTKNLQRPAGTPVPNLTFNFIFTPHSFNDNTANIGQLPTIPTRTVTINSTSTSNLNTPSAGITTSTNSVDALEGIVFEQAGVYAWTVNEVQGATGIGVNSSVVFSEASYRMRVHVRTNPVVISELYIYEVAIYRLVDTQGAAVNPPVRVNYLAFTNVYTRDLLSIIKNLELSEGTTLPVPPPSFDFSFEPTQVQVQLNPPIQSRPVADFAGLVTSPQSVTIDPVTGTDAPRTYSGDLDLWNLFDNVAFPSGGVFVWNVSEVGDSSGTSLPYTMEYDENRFQVWAWANQDGSLYNIRIFPIIEGEGDNYTLDPKVTYINFRNLLSRQIDQTLEITKQVTGRFAYYGTDFIFDLVLTHSDTSVSIPSPLVAHIYYGTNTTPVRTVTITGGQSPQPGGFILRHNERLVVPNLPMNTTFNVTERPHQSFRPDVTVYIGGVNVWEGDAGFNTSLSTGNRVLSAVEGRNAADFTNTFELPPPETGLFILGDIPLFVLVVPVIGLTAYMALRGRKTIERLPLPH
ncbi:MAG: hypothetical protein FWE48_02255 [Coriobacteriia bacterium]|nr:hypothetical protein [Coriobacteriia bacterium]